MKRTALLVCVGWGVLCLGEISFGAAAKARKLPPDEALKRRVPRYTAAGPLGVVLADFAQTAGVKLRVDWTGLEKTGVTKKQRVSIEVEKVTCRQALEVLLAKVGRSGHPLGWRIDEDGVVVSTHRRILLLEQSARSRVRKLVGSARPSPPSRRRTAGRTYRLPGVNFDNLPFRDALRFFQTVTGVNFHVNWRAMKADGIDPDTPISVKVRNVSVARALDLVLDQVNAGRSKLESVYWVVDRGVLLISTGNALNKRVITRVIDASSALMIAPDTPGPRISLETSSTDVTRSTGYGGNEFFDDIDRGDRSGRKEEESLEEKRKKRRETLVAVIKNMIGEEMWQPEGKGSITLMGNNLVISQTLLGFKLLERALR